jgi:hypothetical protein
MSQRDGQTFPFETYFGSCESLGIVRNNACEISRLAILPAFQGSDLFVGFVRVTIQILVHLGLDTVFCLATNKLTSMYQRIGADRVSGPVRHPVLVDEFLNLYRIKTAWFLTGTRMDLEVWKKISEEAMSHLTYYGFLRHS